MHAPAKSCQCQLTQGNFALNSNIHGGQPLLLIECIARPTMLGLTSAMMATPDISKTALRKADVRVLEGLLIRSTPGTAVLRRVDFLAVSARSDMALLKAADGEAMGRWGVLVWAESN